MEANPGKFKLPAGDLQERKVFVERMREAVQVRRVSCGLSAGRLGSLYSLMASSPQDMKDHMVSPAAIAFMERNNREVSHPDPVSSPEPLRETLPFESDPDPSVLVHLSPLRCLSLLCACLSSLHALVSWLSTC